ncbi:hypothetical protein [uncultured Microbacterium sp.]|uniref:glycoside hydrolase family 38 N-terminal domain-containing protein n=1 Tax=uncultured Microbacterium sp. TaxID=191216 RepID=UPI0035CB93DE
MHRRDSAHDYIWEIGSGGGQHPALVDGIFVDGASVAAPIRLGDPSGQNGWPRVHPGPLNESTGFRELTASVEFSLESPDHDLVLELDARGGSGPCPDLRITVNGSDGLALMLQSRTDRAHAPMPPNPTAGVVSRSITIPASLLRDGINRIDVTTISLEPADPAELVAQVRPDLGHWFGSTLVWHRLALRATSGTPVDPIVSVEPLPLYVQAEDGELRELVDVVVRDVGPLGGVSVSADGPIEAHWMPAVAGYVFGDIRWRLSVPDPAGAFEVRVRVATPTGVTESNHDCTPARKWTVHLLPHVHLDVGYTDLQARVIELHSRNLDKALALTEREPDYRFAIDGSLIVEEYARTRTPGRFGQLLDALRDGTLGLNAFSVELLTGVAGLEDLYRAMYTSAALRREHGVPITYANVTDVPTYSSALPSILSAEGIDGFLAMSNHTRGGTADSDALHLLSPVRWQGPDGSTVLSFFSDCYTQLRFTCADPATTVGIAQGLVETLRRYERDDYLPTHFPLVGTNADNEDLGGGYVDLVARWERSYAWPQITFSTAEEYFDAVRPLRDDLPLWTGDGGSFWEDGVGTQAISTAVNRRSQALLPAAETISALAAIGIEAAVPDIRRLDEAWACVIMGSEHTWTADTSTAHARSDKERRLLEWTVEKIAHGSRLAQDELDRALSQLADQISVAGLPAILVVNPLSWARDVWIEIEIALDATITDSDGEDLPLQMLSAFDGLRRVRVRVKDVPAFGYRMLSASHGHSPLAVFAHDAEPAIALDRDAVESALRQLREEGTAHYLVDVDPDTGAIRSLRHKGLDREVLDADVPWRLGDVLYAAGGGSAELRGLGTETNSLYDYDPLLPPAQITVDRGALSLQNAARTPWGWSITTTGSGPTLREIRVEVDLFDDDDRVEVRVEFEKEACLAKESVYVAFPFAVDEPTLRYDRQQGWVDPSRDHYLGACNEWFTVQNAVTVSSPDVSVAWASADAPLFSSSDIVRATWPTRFHAANGSILSWVMNNYWFTNTASSQQGRIALRYAFRPSADLDSAAAAKLGRALRTPGLASTLLQNDRGDKSPRPLAATGSLIDVDSPENAVVSVFAGRNASSLTIRALETAGRPARVIVQIPAALRTAGDVKAVLLTPTEDEISPLEVDDSGAVTVDLAPFEAKSMGLGTRG